MFLPRCCPYRACSQHRHPARDFWTRHGTYKPKCRPHAVQRFLCGTCRRTFSRQTFRMDYRDHRPDLNGPLFLLIASGIGIRQSSRNLGLSLKCTNLKLRKIGRHIRRLNLSLRNAMEGDVSFHLDEIETYEGQRNTRPLSVPVLIESRSRYIIWAESAPIRPRGKMTPKRLKAIESAQQRHGVRRDLSERALKRTLSRAAALAQNARSVTMETDEKSTYRRLAANAFGKGRLVHNQTNSKLVRMTWNPLFAINHEEAVMRDLMGRLRRESWLVSKMRRYLDLALQVHMAYRNLVRRRFNFDEESPAQILGFARRRLTPREVLSWRQDWGERSIHPLSRIGASIEQVRRCSVDAA